MKKQFLLIAALLVVEYILMRKLGQVELTNCMLIQTRQK